MQDFDSLYRRYAGDVHRFALYLSGDPATAEDLVSEAFIRVWAAKDRVEFSTVRGYLFAITRNLYRQGLRRSRRQTTLDASAPDPSPDLARVREEEQDLTRVLRELDTLPESDRTAVLLRALGDTPYEEIAALLGITVGAAKVKVHRARLKLAAVREEDKP
ncbi:MAG: RNA polymerase sigma factor [Candidatus Eisenbacteria bacterium]